MHLLRAFSLSVIIIVLTAVSLQAAPVPTGDWNELIDVTQLPYLKDGIVTQVSSFDRTGGNDDGFSGQFSFIRKEGEDFVIFDEQGPGCIYRIWSANPGKGWVRVYFDGETTPRIEVERFEDLFLGQYQPFVSPIARHFLGGWTSYVPIPFEKSCKIVAQGPVRFLQITWQKFPADRKVKTFSRDMTPGEQTKFKQVVDAWSNLGELPRLDVCTAPTIKTLRGKKSAVLADLKGSGMIRAVKIKIDSKDERILRKALFEVYTDGIEKPTVWSPVGDFFLDGFGQGISKSLLLGKKEGVYYCYFPMPFEKSIKLKVTNQSKSELKLDASILWEPLKEFPKDMGRFYAWWHRQNPTSTDQLFPILEATGRGHWCGVSHAMYGHDLGFLEGDEMLWMDDRDNTKYNGTGTEDYFNGGWYFGATGNSPLYGCGVLEGSTARCLAFRLHLTDYVPFQQKARIGIEHGHGNESKADYAGVAYWYAEPASTHSFVPAPLDDRMPVSLKVPGAVEAEDVLAANNPNAQTISDADFAFRLSGSRAVAAKSTGAPPSISLKVDVPESGIYSLEGQMVASPKGGLVQVLVDGRKAGEPFDTRASRQGIMPIAKLAKLPWIKKGPHEITFSMIKDGKRDYELVVDCIRIKERGLLECEEANVIGSSGEPIGEQKLGEGWSGFSQIFFRPGKPGSYFTLELPVEQTRIYTIYAYFTKAADYAIVQVKLDGKPIGQPFDGYNDGVIRSDRIELGTLELAAGQHEITFEVTGKNEKSNGYLVGVDAILLR